jgi:hypothetical protein
MQPQSIPIYSETREWNLHQPLPKSHGTSFGLVTNSNFKLA